MQNYSMDQATVKKSPARIILILVIATILVVGGIVLFRQVRISQLAEQMAHDWTKPCDPLVLHLDIEKDGLNKLRYTYYATSYYTGKYTFDTGTFVITGPDSFYKNDWKTDVFHVTFNGRCMTVDHELFSLASRNDEWYTY